MYHLQQPQLLLVQGKSGLESMKFEAVLAWDEKILAFVFAAGHHRTFILEAEKTIILSIELAITRIFRKRKQRKIIIKFNGYNLVVLDGPWRWQFFCEAF